MGEEGTRPFGKRPPRFSPRPSFTKGGEQLPPIDLPPEIIYLMRS